MKYNHFKALLQVYRKGSENIDSLHKVGVDLLESPFELCSVLEGMLKTSLESWYTHEGVDWVQWFIHENNWGKKTNKPPLYEHDSSGKLVKSSEKVTHYSAWDKNGEPICYSIKSLHSYLQQHCLK